MININTYMLNDLREYKICAILMFLLWAMCYYSLAMPTELHIVMFSDLWSNGQDEMCTSTKSVI